MYCKTRDIQNEAENHIKVLEDIKREISAMLPYYEESGKGTNYEEAKSRINTLNFAIDFIKWGME